MPARGQGKNDRLVSSYDDEQGNVSTAISGSTQWHIEQINDTGLLIPWLRTGQSDFFQIIMQFTHRRNIGTNLASIHLHAIPGGTVTGNVYTSWAYTWVKSGDAIPAIVGWTSGNTTITVTGSDTWKHVIYPLITNISPPASETSSSILLAKFTRLGSNVLDTYNSSKPNGTATDNFGILYLDAHTQVDRIGSDGEYTNS